MNPAICNAILGQLESQAIQTLNNFKCNWRIINRDGEAPENLSPDRDDKRYGLVISNGRIVRVMPG